MFAQSNFFDGGEPSIDDRRLAELRRIWLDDSAWVDYLPGWVAAHDVLMAHLVASTRFQQPSRRMYDRTVEVPRLVAGLPADGPGHPLLTQIQDALSAHYSVRFPHVSMGFYRDGHDSVAWHGDTFARELPEAIVATVSLGEPRRFLLRPRSGGRSTALALGWGDVVVMGGSCQRTWQHSVPKVAHALPRLAVMYRPRWYKV